MVLSLLAIKIFRKHSMVRFLNLSTFLVFNKRTTADKRAKS